ncbi:Maf family protein [Nitrospira sp. BLG_1]|uniref:Maf family protein n=1 Tax=Nitrospira sp. BLG_1 TaxID=3395883 RepID=UPI0039BCA915
MQLVLASGSPRRKELLALLGVDFEVCTSEFPEHPMAGWLPLEQAKYFAREKARCVARVRLQDFILGSDTVIELDGHLLGKPLHLEDARIMLSRLAGRCHHVHTAVAICCQARGIDRVEASTTHVTMKVDVEDVYSRYLASQESLGKAGAYAIQGLGGDLVERIDGDYTTVVGLPLKLVARLLQSVGYPIALDIEELYHRKPYANWHRFAV